MSESIGWWGVDLDGTLAEYHGWHDDGGIGQPIPLMVERVKRWLEEGKTVKIVTARVGVSAGLDLKDHDAAERQHKIVEAWCVEHLGKALEVTCRKDYGMLVLFDDRCVQVEANTGRILTPNGYV